MRGLGRAGTGVQPDRSSDPHQSGARPLAEEAARRAATVARGYCNLEYDLRTGSRGRRETHVEELLMRLTGAEAAFVVTTTPGGPAAADGTGLRARSAGVPWRTGGDRRSLPPSGHHEGRRVRIGGGGNHQPTRIADFEAAITSETALLLRVHTSNYRILGFTEEAGLAELVDLAAARAYQWPTTWGVGRSPTGRASGRAVGGSFTPDRVDVICFSCDKLLRVSGRSPGG